MLVPDVIRVGGGEGARGAQGGRVEQHADVVAAAVGGGQVQLAVAVEVPHRHSGCPGPGGEVDGAPEGAVALAPQHADVGVIGGGQVLPAVAVEVPYHHGLRRDPDA